MSKISVVRGNLNYNYARLNLVISLQLVEPQRAQFLKDLSKIGALQFLILGNVINYPLPNWLLLLIGYIYNIKKPLIHLLIII